MIEPVDVRIRPRRADDLVACVDALAEVHALDGYPTRWPADPAAWLDPAGTKAAWVAEVDKQHEGTVVGHALLRAARGTSAAEALADAAGVDVADVVMLARLFVRPSARRHGAGRALLHTAEQAAARLPVVLGLDVVGTDRAAIRMYERAGWRQVATLACDWLPEPAAGPPLRCYLAPDGRRPAAAAAATRDQPR